MAIDHHGHQRWQVELLGDEGSDQRADEPDRDRNEKSTTRTAADGSPDGTADSSHNQKHEETEKCDRHAYGRCKTRALGTDAGKLASQLR